MVRKGMIAVVVGATVTASAMAQDRMVAEEGPASTNIETLSIEVMSQDGPLWSGTLTIGPEYGSANFSQSKNEYARPCPGSEPVSSRRSNSNSSFNMGISRSNWQQTPNSFNISFNRTRALKGCEGQGSDTSGLNRTVDIARGGSVTIETVTGEVITVTRP